VSCPDLVCVLTTIQPPTPCIHELANVLAAHGCEAIVVGDRKGPVKFHMPGFAFYSLTRQRGLPFRLARLLPEGHYTRKNLAYLLAAARGARCIYETDDDNRPGASWRPRTEITPAQAVAPRSWLNVYRLYSDGLIWPRGLPLEQIADPASYRHDPAAPVEPVRAPIQQGLANVAADVDAVWRLVFNADHVFRPGPSVVLPPRTWCPFNSQTTWWWPDAYPLLYLPSHCTFRMTDIWRGFVAQRCLWELGCGLVFHSAEAIQDRNPHDLMRDFASEVPGYLHNSRITRILEALTLKPGTSRAGDNLVCCYEALVAAGVLPPDELPLVRAWVEDVNSLTAGVRTASAA
jgi:hypothetical protein